VKHIHWLLTILFALSTRANAGDVVLRITARNPDETNRVVAIKSYLPPEVRPHHIRDLAGTELAYDVRHNMYYVRAAPRLDPHVATTFAIKFHDIWTVPTQYIDRIERHLAALAPRIDSGNVMVSEVAERALAETRAIRERQQANAARLVSINKHVNAYERNILAIEKVVNACRRIEDALISQKSDPNWLVPYFFKPKSASNTGATGERKAMIRISVENTSTTEARTLDVRRNLPFEVAPGDVLDADGMSIGADTRKGVCYVVTNGLKLAAGETKVFNVVIRDRWNVNDERTRSLENGLRTDLGDVRELKRYISVEESLEQLISDLSDIRGARRPTEFGAPYVAFFREETRRLDAIEAMWKRIQRIEFPSESIITPPDRKQTRLIIYAILGLLSFMTLTVVLGSVWRKTGSKTHNGKP